MLQHASAELNGGLEAAAIAAASPRRARAQGATHADASIRCKSAASNKRKAEAKKAAAAAEPEAATPAAASNSAPTAAAPHTPAAYTVTPVARGPARPRGRADLQTGRGCTRELPRGAPGGDSDFAVDATACDDVRREDGATR